MALFSASTVNGADFYAISNGNWNINLIWSNSPGGAPVSPGVWPGAGDNVYIGEGAAGRTVTIPAGYTAYCANLFMGSASTASSATVNYATSTTNSLVVSGNVIIYGPNGAATRSINVNAGTMTVGGNLELGSGQAGTAADRVCSVMITSGTVTVSGDLVYHNVPGSSPFQTLINMSGGAGTFNLAGLFTVGNNLGYLSGGTQSTFNFNGSSVSQVIPSGTSSIVFHHVTCNNTNAGGAVMAGNWTPAGITGDLSVVTGTLDNGGYAITLAPGMDFTVADNATFRLTGNSTMAAVSGGGVKTFGATSTVIYAGASLTNQDVTPELYGHLTFLNPGVKTLLAGTCNVRGDWTVQNAFLVTYDNPTTVRFCGTTAPQSILGSTVSRFLNLEIDNPFGVNMFQHVVIQETFTLTNGIVTPGTKELNMESNLPGSLIGGSAASYVNGAFSRHMGPGSGVFTIPVGDATAYAPIVLDFDHNNLDVFIQFSTSAGDHASIGSSILYASQTVNRTWTIFPLSGPDDFLYDATFHWVSADQDAGFDYTAAFMGRYDGTSWSYPTMGALTATSAQITGMTSFSDFQAGNACDDPPTAIISGDTAVCQTGGTATLQVDLTGTPPWHYTWSDGVNTGTVTGVMSSPSYFNVSPSQSTDYTITLVGDATGCNAFGTGTATVGMGPTAYLPDIQACAGSLIEIPMKVKNFSNIGAISLTLTYDKTVMFYDSYTDPNGFLEYVYCDETVTPAVIRISGTTTTAFNLADDEVLILLTFGYMGGNTDLDFDDAVEDTKCEFACGAPTFEPYCDNPSSYYYAGGSVTDATVTNNFSADDVTPPTHFTVLFTATTPGATSWLWSFDRAAEVQFVEGTTAASQNPKVQFLRGGPYTVSLSASNSACESSEVKVDYIWAGTPGLWTGNTSTDWYTNTNWDDYRVPTGTVNVLIPSVPEGTRYPYVPGDLITATNCQDITIQGPAQITVQGEFIVQPSTNVRITGTGQVVMHFVP